MHPVITLTHWSHHLHSSMLVAWHHIYDHLHSRHFWAGVAVTLLIVGFIALLVAMAVKAPNEFGIHPYGMPLGSY